MGQSNTFHIGGDPLSKGAEDIFLEIQEALINLVFLHSKI